MHTCLPASQTSLKAQVCPGNRVPRVLLTCQAWPAATLSLGLTGTQGLPGMQDAPLCVAPEAQHSPLWPAGPTSHQLRFHAFYRMKMRLLKSGEWALGGRRGKGRGNPRGPSPGSSSLWKCGGPSWPPSPAPCMVMPVPDCGPTAALNPECAWPRL